MEENKIQEAEIISENVIEEKQPTEKKAIFYKKLALVFILGFLLGIALKTEALKKITIGYDDYLMKIETQDYNINQMQIDLSKRMETENEAVNVDGMESDLTSEEDQQ
ncbi:MAG TPA: hypothetical protein DCS28_01425 [Candidatus Moranbacteria bacterium]|nr:hypothetical protein [Candidatus Moranbacteria bacterium]HAT74686.1 hypothetical protein [Candidatus Moranbacteria bacterium]